ncbi:MAG: hypothetical protein U1E77_19850 [Inhella sp.]
MTLLDEQRQAAQLAFAASGAELRVGDPAALPWPLPALRTGQGLQVRQHIDSGLSATIECVEAAGRLWCVKRARPEARVRNVDGQTSFLNEVQRRADIEALKRRDPGRWGALVDTAYADYRAGLIVSPWIAGGAVCEWGERTLGQLFEAACALWLEGLFEWDLCAGNLLDDGRQLRLFDFGYCYRFDPLRQFNSAGRGDDQPLFHPAERFETRCYSALLLQLECTQGQAAALAAFRRAKQAALPAYARMRAAVAARGASAAVLDWLDAICTRWREALRGDAEALYLAEAWRSHRLDLDDDLRGQSCTPTTLARADWLLATAQAHPAALRGALFWGEQALSRAALQAHLRALRADAERFQLGQGQART